MSRTISTSLRLEIVGVYYHSNIKKTDICKKYGISLATLYRILRTFA
ncbi:MAG: helix-turn-helix domain-containing protein, partial [Bacteroidaceae bacterium]|nr:helix-turn-helix domain-containing protein [Bacteroidaceae bacterium]